jgi:hypothetical protein
MELSKLNNEEKARLKLDHLVKKIKEKFPNDFGSHQSLVDAAHKSGYLEISTGQALGLAIREGYSETTERHNTQLVTWLKNERKVEAVFIESALNYKLVEVDSMNSVLTRKPLDFMSFMREVLDKPSGMDIRIIGTWPSAIMGKENQAAIDILRNMVNHCNSVKMLQPRPDSRFFIKRLYDQYYHTPEGDRDFNNKIYDLQEHLGKLDSLRREFSDGKFDFKMYDSTPGMRMFAHNDSIYTSLLLDHIESSETFSTVYPNNDSIVSQQLISHFDSIWQTASNYKANAKRDRPTLKLIGDLAGVYKVYNYCHKPIPDVKGLAVPATQIGALKIYPNGFVEQRTYRSEIEEADINEGWAIHMDDNLFMEIRNVRSPKFTAYSIFRYSGEFDGSPGQYLFGTLVVPKKLGSNPTALRILLQRQGSGIDLDDLECAKIPLSQVVGTEVVPKSARRFLSGIFRNMLRYQQDEILVDASLEREMNTNRVKLGKVMFMYAKMLKIENANQEEIVDAVRWALTHGYRDWRKVEKEFGEMVVTHKSIIELFARIAQENP